MWTTPSAALLAISCCLSSLNCLAQTNPSLSTSEAAIVAKAAASDCSAGPWNDSDDDPAPVGYIKGVALTYVKSYCELKKHADAASVVMAQPVGPASRDALAYYGKDGQTDVDRLRLIYTLGLGVGMIESSGNPTEGPDPQAHSQSAEQAEAGLFQSSFDSLETNPWLRKLYDYYRAHPQSCQLSIFMEGNEDLNKPLYGAGPGASFQRFTKECPAFATEYAMVMFRADRSQYGSIGDRLVKYHEACFSMLKELEAIANCEP
jgi:hypothetical protein